MTENKSIPYTYLICCIPEQKWYYGVQYGKSSNPNNLWKTYFTSSKIIHSLIQKYGKECFNFQTRKIFDCKYKAYKWEQKVLKRLKVDKNCKMLNLIWYNGELRTGVPQKPFKKREKTFSDYFSDYLLAYAQTQTFN